MPGVSSPGIFISYRREDATAYARLLQRDLRERFPDAPVFMDLDSIKAGLDFAEVIEQALGSAAVLVALIGRQWASLTDEEGERRLNNPNDFVRFEVQTALERGVRVIPVLVDGARPLQQKQLPAELHKLARLNALELSSRRYQYDTEQLLGLIQEALAAVSEREEADRQARLEDGQKPSPDRPATQPSPVWGKPGNPRAPLPDISAAVEMKALQDEIQRKWEDPAT
jgi:hypothetical protein